MFFAQVVVPPVVVGLDWSILIPLIFAGIGSLVTTTVAAILAYNNGRKSDAIHVLVNGDMTKTKADLADAMKEIDTLRELVTTLNDKIEVGKNPITVPKP